MTRTRALLFAMLVACVLVVGTTVRASGMCYPGCAIWTDSNPEWHVFFCYLC